MTRKSRNINQKSGDRSRNSIDKSRNKRTNINIPIVPLLIFGGSVALFVGFNQEMTGPIFEGIGNQLNPGNSATESSGSIKIQGPDNDEVLILESFTASSESLARNCITEVFQTRWERQMPSSCSETAGVQGYETIDIKLAIEENACYVGWKSQTENVPIQVIREINGVVEQNAIYLIRPDMCYS